MLNVKFVTRLFKDRTDAIEWTPQGDMFRTGTYEDAIALAVRMNYTLTADRTEIIDLDSGFTIDTVRERVLVND